MKLFKKFLCCTFCDTGDILGAMGKVIFFIILAAMLLGYGKYMTDMQQQAVQNVHNISYMYAHAEEVATQLH